MFPFWESSLSVCAMETCTHQIAVKFLSGVFRGITFVKLVNGL